jgi:hypothetical protein
VARAELTECPGCGKATKTIAGRCPNCGYAKAGVLGNPKRAPGPTISDDLGWLSGWGYGWFAPLPGLVLLALALLVFDSGLLLALGALLLALPIVALVVFGDWLDW